MYEIVILKKQLKKKTALMQAKLPIHPGMTTFKLVTVCVSLLLYIQSSLSFFLFTPSSLQLPSQSILPFMTAPTSSL